MEIIIKTNKDNDEYIDITRSDINAFLVLKNNLIPEDIREYIREMFLKATSYEKENKVFYISKITIRKDSKLGEYLLNTFSNNNGNINALNKDNNITYKKVINAFNIAIYTENPIYEQIYELFKNKITGTYSELAEKYDSTMLDYILANHDFERYLAIENGNYYPNNYFVYESGEFNKRKLMVSTDSSKVKIYNE